MKKIIVAGVVAFAAAFLNAASVDWQFSEQAKNSSSPYDITSFSVYLFTESAWNTATSGGVTADAFGKSVASSALTKTTGGSGANEWTKWATEVLTWTSEDAASGNYLIVLYDGSDKYSVSSALAATAYSSAQEAHTAAKWSITATKTPLGEGDFHSMSGSVPEPTSGLLLLLGMAGLALKRKVA